jgi:glycosyltransferase involved in cell wall biosynthesis
MEDMEGPADLTKTHEPVGMTFTQSQAKTIWYLVHCFYPFSQGGTERFIYNMAQEARKKGNRVRIITYNATKGRREFANRVKGIFFNEYLVDGLDVVEYRHKRAPLGILKDVPVSDRDVYAFAEHLAARERPDFLHVGYIQKVSSFIAACREMQIPYGVTLTSYFCFCHYDSMIDRRGRLCNGSVQGTKCRKNCGSLDIADSEARYRNMYDLLNEAAFVTAPSLFVKKMVEKDFAGINVLVINHGVSRKFISDITVAGKRSAVKSFAYLGSLSPIKGVHGLINAFIELPPGYALNIYGTGSESYLRYLKKLAGKRSDIVFRGGVNYNEVHKAYEANDVIVVPSIWYETYNFVIHEALLIGKLVIAASIGAMGECIVNGVNGFTFRPGDWGDLKSVMRSVAVDNQIMESVPSHSIATIDSEFEQYDNLYLRERVTDH